MLAWYHNRKKALGPKGFLKTYMFYHGTSDKASKSGNRGFFLNMVVSFKIEARTWFCFDSFDPSLLDATPSLQVESSRCWPQPVGRRQSAQLEAKFLPHAKVRPWQTVNKLTLQTVITVNKLSRQS